MQASSSIKLFVIGLSCLLSQIPGVLLGQTGSLTGTIVDRYTQRPLSGVSIRLDSLARGTISDSNGAFVLKELELRTYNIRFSRVGYKPETVFNIPVNAGNVVNLNIELDPAPSELTEVVVRSGKKSARAATIESPLSVQRLTSEEIRSNPGGNFDISKAIQTLPGVGGGAQGGSFRNDIIIRGGAPDENVFYLDGIEIPVINHFQTQGSSGGPQGILNVSFIEDVKLSSSAFDARYDNALSSVFQFRERTGNPTRLQGNLRLSASELAATLEGPLRNKNTSFLFSARRSYLQLLFSLLDLPLRPDYWDFQTKITHVFDAKTTLTVIGIGAIDHFSFAPVRHSTPENDYILNSNPFIRQWTYTGGATLRRLMGNGFLNIAVSRNAFDNKIFQFEDNQEQLPSQQTLDYRSRETENKLRIDMNKTVAGWRVSYGSDVQYEEYANKTFQVLRKQLYDSSGQLIQPGQTLRFTSPLGGFWRYGAFVQLSKRFFDDRLGISGGLRSDMDGFTLLGKDIGRRLSPRFSVSYSFAPGWRINASIGRYYKIPSYTVLGFADSAGRLLNKGSDYRRSDHYVAGVEYLPNDGLRFTTEVFYKRYANEPVSLADGISLANKGTDFTALGNEQVLTSGKGKAYGVEFFAQKKLTRRFFGIFSYTFYRSLFSGLDGILRAGSWDNRHLVSATFGYKFRRGWELGLKFRYQGGAPYSPYDSAASRANYLSLGKGIFDYSKLNTLRLPAFNAADIRIDKKWNLRKITVDLFLDVTNFYAADNKGVPYYTFRRTADNKTFLTTNGKPVSPDGANAIPYLLANSDNSFTPSIGFIFEF